VQHPIFKKNQESLIPAANHSGLFICYPLQSYANGNHKPTHGNAVIIGPDLDGNDANSAYFLLGQMASNVLGGVNLPNPNIPVPEGMPNPQ
jgi:hypothetical protein